MTDGLQTARTRPNNLEAERALLGCMILSKEVQTEASSALTCEDFFSSTHRIVFEAIQKLVSEGREIDLITLPDRLDSMGKLAAVGGYSYLTDLSGSAPATTYWERYSSIIKRLSTYRQLIDAATSITAMSYEAPEDSDEAVGFAESAIMEVTHKRISNEFVALSEQLYPAQLRFEEFQTNKGKTQGIPTGFSSLNRLTGGFGPGNLIVLAARPAVGKSAFALNVAAGAAKAKVKVAVFSLEMSVEDITMRFMCSEARISMTAAKQGELSNMDWGKIGEAMSSMSEYDIAIDDSPSLNITQLRAKARRYLRNCEGKGLVIVDYLQLMQPARRNTESRQVEIAEISRGLKILAKDLNVPVLALSQLSRAVESRKGQRPMLSDLRESGAIEQDADMVMFLDRQTIAQTEEDSNRPPKGMADLIIAKHRNGEVGSIRLGFAERYTRFEELANANHTKYATDYEQPA